MGFAQAAFLYRRFLLVDYLNPIANYDFILGLTFTEILLIHMLRYEPTNYRVSQ